MILLPVEGLLISIPARLIGLNDDRNRVSMDFWSPNFLPSRVVLVLVDDVTIWVGCATSKKEPRMCSRSSVRDPATLGI